MTDERNYKVDMDLDALLMKQGFTFKQVSASNDQEIDAFFNDEPDLRKRGALRTEFKERQKG